MKISKDNRNIINILELLLFDNTEIGIKLFPFLFFQKEHIKQSDFTIFEIKSVLKKLKVKNYLKKIKYEDFQKEYVFELEKISENYGEQALELGVASEDLVKENSEYLEEHGFRMNEINHEKVSNIFEHPDFKKNIEDTFEENFAKSKNVESYRILGDLYKLIHDLKNGRDFKTIESNYSDLYYKKSTSELFIKDENSIKINKISTRKTQDDLFITALMKRGKEKTHYFSELMKDKVFRKEITSENYFDMCKSVQQKIENQSKHRVSDFLIFSHQYVKINPKYYKKLPQLTLEIT